MRENHAPSKFKRRREFLELLEARDLLCARFTAADDYASDISSATCELRSNVQLGEFEVAGDVDVFTFTAQFGDVFSYRVMQGEVDITAWWDIVGIDGQPIFQRPGSDLWRALATDTYFLVGTDGWPDLDHPNPYEIEWNFLSADDHSDEMGELATVLIEGQSETAELPVSEDVDAFVYYARAGERFRIYAESILKGARYEVFDEEGRELKRTGTFAFGPAKIVQASKPAPFFIRVYQSGLEAAEMSLRIETLDFDEPNSVADFEPPEFQGQVSGKFHFEYDTDVFAFRANPCEVYEYTLDHFASPSLRIHDVDGNYQMIDGQSWYADLPGIYYFEIAASDYTGNYDLEVRKSDREAGSVGKLSPPSRSPVNLFYAAQGESLHIEVDALGDLANTKTAIVEVASLPDQHFLASANEGDLVFNAPATGQYLLRVIPVDEEGGLSVSAYETSIRDAAAAPMLQGQGAEWLQVGTTWFTSFPTAKSKLYAFSLSEPRLLRFSFSSAAIHLEVMNATGDSLASGGIDFPPPYQNAPNVFSLDAGVHFARLASDQQVDFVFAVETFDICAFWLGPDC